MDTRMGDIVLSGKPTEVALPLSATAVEPITNDSTIIREATSGNSYASPFTATETAIFNTVSVLVKPGTTITVEVIVDDTGAPSTDPGDVIASAIFDVPSLILTTANYGPELGVSPLGFNQLGRGLNVTNAIEVVLAEVPISGAYSSGTTIGLSLHLMWLVITRKREVPYLNWMELGASCMMKTAFTSR
jgi:hypothetical protein